MSKPESYREQVKTGCWNCKHCFSIHDWDSSNEYYCHIDKSKRPLNGHGNENFTEFYLDDIKYNQLVDDWEKWAETRKVSESGICDKYEKYKNIESDESK